jgi:hypothetical protein
VVLIRVHDAMVEMFFELVMIQCLLILTQHCIDLFFFAYRLNIEYKSIIEHLSIYFVLFYYDLHMTIGAPSGGLQYIFQFQRQLHNDEKTRRE